MSQGILPVASTTATTSRSSSRLALREINLRSQMDSANSEVSPFAVELNVPDSFLTPSPDELVIRQRGRKQRSQISAEMQCQEFLNLLHSPTKPKSPAKSPKKSGNLPTRSSPRKRLQLSDSPTPPNVSSSNKSKATRTNPQPVKRQRCLVTSPTRAVELSGNVERLSHNQLTELIEQLLLMHPNLEQEVRSMLPSHGIYNLEERLITLRRDIFSALFRSRLSRKSTDSYDHVAVHIDDFKRECLEQSRMLLSHRQWSSVIEHVVLAYSYVASLPDLELPASDDSKKQCFSTLASNCLTALKSDSFDRSRLSNISRMLKKVVRLSPEINPVREYIKDLLVDVTEKSDSESEEDV